MDALRVPVAVLVFVVAQVVGVIKLGPAGYFKKKFLLPGAPWWVQPLALIIMPIVLLAEPFSLAVRLFANMTAGHMVMLTFASAQMVGGVWLASHPNVLVKAGAVLPFALSVVLLAFEKMLPIPIAPPIAPMPIARPPPSHANACGAIN